MNENQLPRDEFCRCYRCPAGCIHVVCGATMIRLSPAQFASLAQATRALALQMMEEQTPQMVC